MRHGSRRPDRIIKNLPKVTVAVVAYGFATCEPCKQYDPILEDTAAKFPSIKIGKAKMHVPADAVKSKKRTR